MADDRPDVDELLATTLWSPKFAYRPPRFLPRPRVSARRISWKAGKWLRDLVFERGLETSAHAIEPDHLHPDRVWYQPSGWNFLPGVLRRKGGPFDRRLRRFRLGQRSRALPGGAVPVRAGDRGRNLLGIE